MSAALRVLSPENRTAMPRESFRAFSKIVCGHHELDGERIPSLNWYEDNDIKSFLGKNGTEDMNVEHNNNTSKMLCSFCGRMLMAICADKTWLEALILLYFRVHLHHLNQHNPTEKHLCCLTIVLLGGFLLPAAPFCKNLIQALESNPLSRIVWRGIKPLFIGKLLYTPNTPAIQQVMKEVQQSYTHCFINRRCLQTRMF